MAIDRQTVRHIARLAYLELPRQQTAAGEWVEPESPLYNDAQLDKLVAELDNILAHVEQLSELELEDVEATSHGVPLPPLFREDREGATLETERALAGAPKRGGDSFSVPKIIE